MKKILGLDLGTNSIGWALLENDFEEKEGKIVGLGSRIIPLAQDILDKFGAGQSYSQTAERTNYRGKRRLYQRHRLRRERLHRVLNILGFLPAHYANAIDFDKHFGQFKEDYEVKLNYRKNNDGKFEFIFKDSFLEMVEEFKQMQPELFYKNKNTKEAKLPYDWTIYYLRKKALSEKISKEELAWIILNFNSKRGYYQLRGEDKIKNEDEAKEKIFVVLKVKDVIDSGEIIKKSGKKLYDVYFECGWKYDKQITKTENWIGKTKEFIVTTTIKKDGKIKRTFKNVDSEKDWPAIKAKIEQDIKSSGKKVGAYIYETLLNNPKQKIRGKLVQTIERKFYKEELEAILIEQMKYHDELKDKHIYAKCVDDLYPRNEIHNSILKQKGFKELIIDDIIFYQRPLKSKKSTIANCTYETRTYVKDGIKYEQPLKGIPKSHPLFQEFRLWQWLKNLKIYQKERASNGIIKLDVEVTEELLPDDESRVMLFDFLKTKTEIDQNQFLKYFSDKNLIPKQKKNAPNYRWNYVEDKKYPCNETSASFLSRLKKVEGLNIKEFFTQEIELQLWHIIYSVKDKNQYDKTLKNFAVKNNIDKKSFFSVFEKYPPFKSAYGSYSEKALKKILPLMRMGKYWNENLIEKEVKDRVARIKERLEVINYDENVFKDDRNNKLKSIVDDEIPKQLLKSFLPFKNKNHLEGLNTYQACYAVYERHSETSEITKWNTPTDIDTYLENFKQHSLRNPIVEQVITETLRTVRDIWQYYGNGGKDFFDEIHIELGRDMKNPADKRKRISERIRENENTNQRIKALLQELITEGAKPFSPNHQEILKIYEEGVYQNPDADFYKVSETEIENIRKKNSPSKTDIQKYKLWLEQGYRSPYTGKIIPLGKLFSTEYQIEHIIPQARYFDNSLSNKVICESEVNKLKGDKTAYEFINDSDVRIIDLGQKQNVKLLTIEQYEVHCKRYFSRNRIKLKKLLSKEIPEGFIERQLNDTRYISKFIKGLLSNIVREENEKEITSKNLIPVTGAITTKLKIDWGLNEIWNEIIQPRFERLNNLTNSKDFGDWDYQRDENGKILGKKFFRLKIPDGLSKGFSKKRLDHRHHALDALVIACTTRKHIQYLNSLNNKNIKYTLQAGLFVKNDKGHFTKQFAKPWNGFTVDAKKALEHTIISFKQNLRVINRTNNKYWKYEKQIDGSFKKKLKEQEGKNFAIRKSMHTPLPYGEKEYSFTILEISKNIGKRKFIIDDEIKVKIEELLVQFDGKIGDVQKYLKKNPIMDNANKPIVFTVFNIKEKRYRKRQPIQKLSNRGQGGIKSSEQAIKFINKVSDIVIRHDLLEHLKENNYDIDKAFSIEGIEIFNSIRKIPVYKLPISEASTGKFALGKGHNTKVKFGEAESGTNLFFAIYWNEEKQKREFETIPLNNVIEHQIWRAKLSKEEMKKEPIIPINQTKGRFLFSLSPNDLVNIPTEEEMEYPHNVDFKNLTKEQFDRIYIVNDFSNITIYFTPNRLAKAIAPREVDLSVDKKGKLKGSYDIKTATFNGTQIKEFCWKLGLDRLGNIINVVK